MYPLALRCLILTLLLLAPVLRAEVRTFTPMHADVQALLPSVEALLRPGESVSVYRDTLVVNADEPSLQRIEQLLHELDKAPRNLMISLRRRGNAAMQSGGGAIGGTVQSGDLRITTTRAPAQGSGVETRTQERVSTASRTGEQSVRALEGHPVRIRDGQLVALGRGGEWAEIDYAELSEGLAVSARVNGERVTLELSAQNDRVEGNAVRTGSLESTVSGRLGDWIWLGGTTRQGGSHAEGITATASTRSRGEEQYEVRVELAP